MATVTGLTKERMLQIEAASVTGGLVDPRGNLILKTHGGDEIDAGHVEGAPGVGPVGSITMFAGADAPSGHLLCDGSAVSRATYSALFAVIGTTYGAGNGSTTFNVPNLKGRVPVGQDTTQTEFDTLGERAGAKTHTLSVPEMPSHTHTQNSHNHTQNSHTHTQNSHTHTQQSHTHTQQSHTHTQTAHAHSPSSSRAARVTWSSFLTGITEPLTFKAGSSDVVAVEGTGSGTRLIIDRSTSFQTDNSTAATNNDATAVNDSSTAINNNATASNNSATATNNATTATNQSTGGGQAHNNLQPYIVLNYIIKA